MAANVSKSLSQLHLNEIDMHTAEHEHILHLEVH